MGVVKLCWNDQNVIKSRGWLKLCLNDFLSKSKKSEKTYESCQIMLE